MQNLNDEKGEVQMRLRHDATFGPGSAEALYASELARRIALFEGRAGKETSGSGRELPRNLALGLGRLRTEGLSSIEKQAVLRVAAGRAPAAAAPAQPPSLAPAPPPSYTPPAASAASRPAPADAYPLTSEYESIEDAADRTRFYRQNKAALDSEHRRREAAAVAPATKPTSGGTIIERLMSIKDGKAHVEFYRQNKAAIDAAYRNLNL